MMYLFLLLSLLALSACDDRTTEQRDADAAISCAPQLVSVAPDGVSLYVVKSRCPKIGDRDVYFSSSGTQTSHSAGCGKGCTRTVDDIVPNGEIQ